MVQSRDSFHWADYVVFSAVLLLSVGIGIITSCTGGKQKTQGEYFMGNRQMSLLPVAMSICVSFISAILILGAPAEMYMYGTQYWITWVGLTLASLLAGLIFVPLLYPLNLTSSYEYLGLRFNSKTTQIVGSLLLITSQTIYMGIATYSPSTALEAVTGFPVWGSVLIVGLVSTLYTTLGGMKGVIWTDVFQTVIMVGGLLAVVIVGSIEVGGIGEVWNHLEEWDRVEFFNFDPDPTTRHTFWTLIVGNCISWLATFGINQASVQRYSALPTQNKAKMSLMLNAVGVLILVTLTCLTGVVVFAYFAYIGCDPLADGAINNPNQVLPYFVMQVLAYPGFPGVFVATLFAGALSTMSSGINAMAAVTWEDMLKPYFDHLPEERKTFITKIIVCLYGLAGTAMAFAAQQMGGTVLQASQAFTGSAMSPLLGLFILGGFFPWANWQGAVVGAAFGLALPMWISIGAYSITLESVALATPIEACVNFTASTALPPPPPSGISLMYTVSYLWYPSIGVATTVIIGLAVSFMFGANNQADVNRKYLIPFFDRLFCCFPNRWRSYCRCGYVESEDEKEDVVGDETEVKTEKWDNEIGQFSTRF